MPCSLQVPCLVIWSLLSTSPITTPSTDATYSFGSQLYPLFQSLTIHSVHFHFNTRCYQNSLYHFPSLLSMKIHNLSRNLFSHALLKGCISISSQHLANSRKEIVIRPLYLEKPTDLTILIKFP